jgi:hypothetical protein
LTAAEMRAHDPEGLWGRYYSFAFVRNPWDRLVSEFHWRQQRAPERWSFPDFSMFLDAVIHGWDFEFDDRRHIMSQKAFVTDEAGGLLVDFVGRHEHLERDMGVVLSRLGLPAARLPVVNRSGGRTHYSRYFDAESRAQVARHYADDIAFFGHTFEEGA